MLEHGIQFQYIHQNHKLGQFVTAFQSVDATAVVFLRVVLFHLLAWFLWEADGRWLVFGTQITAPSRA